MISFIEQKIEASKILESANDYRYWILTLVQNFVSLHSSGFNVENIENRIREICIFLLGKQFPKQRSDFRTSSSATSTPLISKSLLNINSNTNKILGLNKHELLKEILSVLSSNISLQRLYIEFKEQLDSFNHSSLNSSLLSNRTQSQARET